VAGYVLLALGVLLLAANLGWLDVFWGRLVWPLLLVVLGVALLVSHGTHGRRAGANTTR
jgi:hypothetical protein